MSIQQEEILLKNYITGTTLTFFSTHLNVIPQGQLEQEYSPSIVELNNINEPISLKTFDGYNIWTMNNDNIYVPTSSITSNYITGYSYSVKFNEILREEKIETYKYRFTDSIYNLLINSTPSGNTIPYHKEYVFTNTNEIDDFYVNIKLKRTFSTLDTLNIYNNIVNSIPTQQSETGVVFGRLMALQTIKDAEGNNIRIPLKNVPVGVFNPSEDYPTSSSVSENGDRIFLNIKESANPNEYFNIESFNLDKDKLLRSGSQFDSVPEQYKYITKTNEEGEFVIYDVPIGTQTVVFEVDLLKQGLTRDEIALNFFPFPPDDDAIIDQIPNFSFKQFPIDVVPSWGTTQTGYTELDVVVNMDLRKWTTYFFPPVSLYAQKIETLVAQNAANTVKIEVRNMAKEGYPKTDIKMALVPDDLDRVFNQQLNWNLEFAQIRNKAEFYKFGCPIVKLPANLYDPHGYRTDANGIPTNHKGVWLSAYQFNLYTDPNGPNRKSGGIYLGNNTKSHFDLNYSNSNPNQNNTTIGSFPYERPWTIEYPSKYSIPQKPIDERYRTSSNRTPTSTPNIYYLDEPAYNDGDLIGYEVNNDVGGFGSQSAFGSWFSNRISQVATKNFMYKYESNVAWNETYANGYQPSNSGYTRFAGISKVVNGEKYQRFEAGYGYFMKPSGWPRICRKTWGADTYFTTDITHSNAGGYLNGDPNNPGPGVSTSNVFDNLWGSETHINDIYNINNINIALALDKNSIIKKGTLEAYRIIDSNPNNLKEVENFLIPTSVLVKISSTAERAFFWGFRNDGDVSVDINTNLFSSTNNGSSLVVWSGGYFLTGTQTAPQKVTLNPGQQIVGYNYNNRDNFTDNNPIGRGDAISYTTFRLPGNYNYNSSTNRYDSGRYTFLVLYTGSVYNFRYYQETSYTLNTKVFGAEDIWYVKTSSSGGDNGKINNGLNTKYSQDPSKRIYSMRLDFNDNTSYDL